jgi:CheY-like chemotaxis protein
MANIQAVHSVGQSIVTDLNYTYPGPSATPGLPACKFVLLSSGELAAAQEEDTRITLYLFRILVASSDDPAKCQQARQAGCATLLVKPVTPSVLRHTLAPRRTGQRPAHHRHDGQGLR